MFDAVHGSHSTAADDVEDTVTAVDDAAEPGITRLVRLGGLHTGSTPATKLGVWIEGFTAGGAGRHVA
jgi:hypothetical protein